MMLFDGGCVDDPFPSTVHGLRHQCIGFLVFPWCRYEGFGKSPRDRKWNCRSFKFPKESALPQGDPS